MITKEIIADKFRELQDRICQDLEQMDGNSFKEDLWERPGGGGGRTRVIQGKHIEKGGVNFSAVHGAMPDNIRTALQLEPNDFFATGVSIVLHPYNPHVPIIHMNVRYFETSTGAWWFGGGIDMTPHYINIDEAKDFHVLMKEICNRHDSSYYDRFKKWADEYFYIKHRKESRGIGGIFFDKLSEEEKPKSELLDFVLDVGYNFTKSYDIGFTKNHLRTFTEEDKSWQYLRRSRYAEFNLVWDRGTKFGLHTDGNIESILMSLPPELKWIYKYQYNPTEQKTVDILKSNIDWINYKGE